MQRTRIATPRACVQLGLAVTDITPPVGIYHRLWGAASHERASGIHRPLQAEVLASGPLHAGSPHFLRVQMDHVGFIDAQHQRFIHQLGAATGIPANQIVITYSHTHSGGWYLPDRFQLPGGELIPPYLAALGERLAECAVRAVADAAPTVLEFSTTPCAMAANRNCKDEAAGQYVCGFNPDLSDEQPVTVARLTTLAGELRGTIVHYACHPTTLGWESSVISPDFVGALREVVERATGRPCVYFQGACGELGPRDGFVGETATADRNGRAVGYAALSAFELLGPPLTDFEYAGPVISGATLGVWKHVPCKAAEREQAEVFLSESFTLELPKRNDLQPAALQQDFARWEEKASAAAAQGDAIQVRNCRAYAERAKRWLARLADLPPGETFPLHCSLQRLGDALWVTTGGEPFHWLQAELQRRFPTFVLLVSPLAGNLQAAYLLPRGSYGLGLYQEEPSLPAPGCLELLCDGLTARISQFVARP